MGNFHANYLVISQKVYVKVTEKHQEGSSKYQVCLSESSQD